MATTNQTFPFPHPTLTRIQGEPDADSVEQLKSEVYANVQCVSSPFGGGNHGHLGAVTVDSIETVNKDESRDPSDDLVRGS